VGFDMNAQENTLATLRHHLAALEQQRQAAEADLSNKIEVVALIEKSTARKNGAVLPSR
jgi:hypothetical protein